MLIAMVGEILTAAPENTHDLLCSFYTSRIETMGVDDLREEPADVFIL